MTDFKTELRQHLLDAESRLALRRTRAKRAIATAATVVVIAFGGVFAESQLAPDAAIAEPLSYDTVGSYVEVRLVDGGASFEEIEASLRERGLHVAVTAVPVAPSDVNHFIASANSTDEDAMQAIDARNGAFSAFRVRADSTLVHLYYGRLARSGETYTKSADAYLPGNVLYCSHLFGKTKAEAQAFADEHELSLMFQDPSNSGGNVVTNAVQVGPGKVIAFLSTTSESNLVSSDSAGCVDP